MSEKNNSQSAKQTLLQRILSFLGSMDLAITLLLALAIASIIGTVLQQNQPYTDYLLKFGPFWFELFETAGLYDVYSALWFLSILTLLVISTSVCVIRNTPNMLKDMWDLRTQEQDHTLKTMAHNRQWTVDASLSDSIEAAQHELKQQGFRVKQSQKEQGILLSSMRGGLNRIGYISTHVAIIVICIGGLIDSNLYLKLAEWQGKIAVETRDLPTSKIPDKSRLSPGIMAFRGSIHIPEGRRSAITFIAVRDGYLVQELPFEVEVKDFRIEHYATGQPKSFESDLIIYDDDLAEPIEQTISVNHPLSYKGYTIYQASFSDGGSELDLQAWPLTSQAGNELVEFNSKVFENRKMHWGDKSLQLEILSFRPFNINPDPTEDDPQRLRNFGPSFGFKLRDDTGVALEYLNYMLPVPRNGRDFYLSGVRASPAEEFAYLYLPLDDDGELHGFNSFLAKLRQPTLINEIAHTMMLETLSTIESQSDSLQNSLQKTLISLVAMYEKGGFEQVSEFIETTLPEAEKETLGKAYLSMLREMLARIYFHQLNEPSAEISEQQLLFLQDAVDAIGSLSRYGAPIYLELTDYKHVEASGLQITRSPGKSTVYLGCALLIIGVFILFYLPQRRLWLSFSRQGNKTSIVIAGMSNRDPRGFAQFFEQISQKIKIGNSDTK